MTIDCDQCEELPDIPRTIIILHFTKRWMFKNIFGIDWTAHFVDDKRVRQLKLKKKTRKILRKIDAMHFVRIENWATIGAQSSSYCCSGRHIFGENYIQKDKRNEYLQVYFWISFMISVIQLHDARCTCTANNFEVLVIFVICRCPNQGESMWNPVSHFFSFLIVY